MRDQAERTEATEFLSDARLLAAACGLLLIVKVWLASRLDLYSDEIFYWLASTMPAPAYSDLPFVTALLAGLGSALDPGNPLATRALFLAGGSCLPAVVYWVSLPFAGRRDALQAALLSICIPLGGFLGLLAVPDVPMLLCGLIGLGFLDRALRTDGIGHWLAAGAFMALGLCTHYRFVLFPAAAMLHLLLHRRDVWRNGGFLLAAGIAAIGLFPILWANLPGNMGSASFYFVERHPWQFNAEGLL
ncbi:MAG: glycosyltransferase family 39 protein, partial [Gammaproteobacteria bacterium]|nr:glycosyltransferase family 39 protein [Gammaproteobacteria bacterium]